ncbi:MAG: dihydroorotase [Flavobacteriales bacterium]|nr:dihydroorotase [Flavobacteriales bacterium]
MSKDVLIKNATVINEGHRAEKDVLISGERISRIDSDISTDTNTEVLDAKGLLLLPGLIDDQVHFRQPGLTHKADIATESAAAVAGGITSFMEMPNTIPQTLTQDLLDEKYALGAEHARANYSFFMGVSNENIEEVLKTDFNKVCGLKIFMGSSTGDMLVDDREVLETIFSKARGLIAVHCEDEATVRKNTETAKARFGEDIPMAQHPVIRDAEACYRSSSLAVSLAKKHGARLHILHISTAKELELFSSEPTTKKKRITAEACVHHLWFSEEDYATKGSHIKWNPAVKKRSDRDALRKALSTDLIDVLATDHAPHTKEEKSNSYLTCPSGGPLVQHALPAWLELTAQGVIDVETIVRKGCHMPAEIFGIKERGYIREGYYADLVLVDPDSPWTVSTDNILYKCGWSPFEGTTFRHAVKHTFINGHHVYDQGRLDQSFRGMRLEFSHE